MSTCFGGWSSTDVLVSMMRTLSRLEYCMKVLKFCAIFLKEVFDQDMGRCKSSIQVLLGT